MGCFRNRSFKQTDPRHKPSFHQEIDIAPNHKNPNPGTKKDQEVILRIPACRVDLVDEGEAIELARSDFRLVRYLDGDVPLATIIKVGGELQWPLTKDEPVVKLGSRSYLFTLPVKDGDALSYGVSFLDSEKRVLGQLDSFLKEHSCFSDSARNKRRGDNVDWKEFAARIEAYKNVLAKAIAGGTGQIIRGIFICSNAYTNQVQKGGEMIQARAEGDKGSRKTKIDNNRTVSGTTKNNRISTSLKRVRNLSGATEKLSKAMLDGVGVATGSMMAPVVNSRRGQAFLNMVPGEVLVASLDAVNRILDAGEAAERQAFSATSGAATRMVSQRFGESAGDAAGDALATAGHCAGTAWNVFKIRKALHPSSAAASSIARNATKK